MTREETMTDTQSQQVVPRDCDLQYSLEGYNLDSCDGGALVDEVMSFNPDGSLRSKNIMPMDDAYTSTPGGQMVRSCMIEALLDMTYTTISAETKQIIDDHGDGGHADYQTVERVLYLFTQLQAVTSLVAHAIEATDMADSVSFWRVLDGFRETTEDLQNLRHTLETSGSDEEDD